MFDIVSPFAPARSFERDSTSSFGEAEALEGYETSPETSFEDVGVIDGDDRAPVTPTTDVPWRWMCHLQIKDSRGRLADHGSGLLISNRHVLTAAHIVWAASVDPQLYTVEVRPGRDDAAEPFGMYTSSRIRVSPRYKPSADDHFEWDYALITLSTAIGKNTFKSIGNRPLGYWGSADTAAASTSAPAIPLHLFSRRWSQPAIREASNRQERSCGVRRERSARSGRRARRTRFGSRLTRRRVRAGRPCGWTMGR